MCLYLSLFKHIFYLQRYLKILIFTYLMKNLNDLLTYEIGEFNYTFKDLLFELNLNLIIDNNNSDLYYFSFLNEKETIIKSKLLSFSLTNFNVYEILVSLKNYYLLNKLELVSLINNYSLTNLYFDIEDIENEHLFNEYLSSINLYKIFLNHKIDLKRINEEVINNKDDDEDSSNITNKSSNNNKINKTLKLERVIDLSFIDRYEDNTINNHVSLINLIKNRVINNLIKLKDYLTFKKRIY